MATLSYRTIFISDTHLGLRAARTEYLLDFLKHVECENLFLVGDIFDIWKMRTGWYWPSINNEIIRQVLEMARRGARVCYIPDNHDELFREYQEFHFSGIDVCREATHQTRGGRDGLPQSHGHLWSGDAGGHGFRGACRRLPGGGPTGCHQKRHQWLVGRGFTPCSHAGTGGRTRSPPGICRGLLLGVLHAAIPLTNRTQSAQ